MTSAQGKAELNWFPLGDPDLGVSMFCTIIAASRTRFVETWGKDKDKDKDEDKGTFVSKNQEVLMGIQRKTEMLDWAETNLGNESVNGKEEKSVRLTKNEIASKLKTVTSPASNFESEEERESKQSETFKKVDCRIGCRNLCDSTSSCWRVLGWKCEKVKTADTNNTPVARVRGIVCEQVE